MSRYKREQLRLLIELEKELKIFYSSKIKSALQQTVSQHFEANIFPGDSQEKFLYLFPREWDSYQEKLNLLYPFRNIVDFLQKWDKIIWINFLLWSDKEHLQFRGHNQHHIRIIYFDKKHFNSLSKTHQLASKHSHNFIEWSLSLTYLLYPKGLPPHFNSKPSVIIAMSNDDLPSYNNDVVLIKTEQFLNNLQCDYDFLEKSIQNNIDYQYFDYYSNSHYAKNELNKISIDNTYVKQWCNYLIWLKHTHSDLKFYYVFPSILPNKEGISGINIGTKKPLSKEEFEFINMVSSSFGNFLELSMSEYRAEILIGQVRSNSRKAIFSQVLARNFSHNIGSHVMHNADVSKVLIKLNSKQTEFEKEADELNAYRYAAALKSLLDRYVVQRNEYLADVSENTMPAGNYARLYAEVLMPFVENFLLTDNIATAEGIGFPTPDADNRLQIRVFIKKDHGKPELELITLYDRGKKLLQYEERQDMNAIIQSGYPNTPEVLFDGHPLRLPYRLPLKLEGTQYSDSNKVKKLIQPRMLEAFFHTRQVMAYDPMSKAAVPDNGASADVEVALPGVLGRHALYSLLENFIRNSAKHNNESLKTTDRQLTIKIQLSPLEDEDIRSGRFGSRDDAWCVRISDDNLSWLTDEEDSGKGQFQKLQDFIHAPLITGQTGEPRTTGLGIADMVVSASVLAGSFDFDFSPKNTANKFFQIERVEQKDGKCTFAYRFYLLKAKRIICLTKRSNPQGKQLGWSIQGITFVQTVEDLYSKLGRQSYRFAVLDADILDEELGNDPEKYETLLRRLPYRVIVKENISPSDNSIGHHRRILQAQRRLVVYNGEISSDMTPPAFQEFCWQQWLKSFFFPTESMPLQLHLYLEHEHAGWERMEIKDFGGFLNLRVYHSQKNDFQYQNDRTHLIYDHHGRLMEKLKGRADFLHNDKYTIFDKNSADFPRLLYSDEQTLEMMPYMMAEAAMLRILVMDERVAERADEDADMDAQRLESADRQFRKADGVNDSIMELAWAGGVHVATHLQINDGEERPIHEKAQQRPHAPKLTMHVLAEAGKSGKIQFYSNLHCNNTQKTIESAKDRFDVLLIHRTILKQIQDSAKSVSEEFDFLRDIKDVIPFVVVDSGGGYPEEIHQEYKGSFKFLPFSFMSEHLLRNRIAKIGLVQLLLGLTEANRESTA